MIRAGFLLAMFVGWGQVLFATAETTTWELFDLDAEQFVQNWQPRGFPLISPTTYLSRVEQGRRVVNGRSESANRALLRRGIIAQPQVARLRWSWRVLQGLSGDTPERVRAGDDFAARVFVVFETSVIPTRTRAINYVWAVNEAPGTSFPSPYSSQVAHFVLRSDRAGAAWGEWYEETRDVLADYEAFFGEPASIISAVAIMVDADNTQEVAEAEFADLVWEISSVATRSSP